MVSAGDGARLARMMAKARRGETVTVALTGGSITAGSAASKGHHYGELVAATSAGSTDHGFRLPGLVAAGIANK